MMYILTARITEQKHTMMRDTNQSDWEITILSFCHVCILPLHYYFFINHLTLLNGLTGNISLS